MSKRICIFGASITHGAEDLVGGGWVERLKVFFWQGDEYSVYNLGISGDTTEEVLKRIDQESAVRQPAIIMISLGNNDSSYRVSLKSNKTSLEKFKSNFEKIIKISREFTPIIIFVGLTMINEKLVTPTSWNQDAYYYEKNIREYNSVLNRVAQENNLFFIPMSDVLDKNDLPDGLHPNAEGHEKMFKRVKEFLIENKIV